MHHRVRRMHEAIRENPDHVPPDSADYKNPNPQPKRTYEERKAAVQAKKDAMRAALRLNPHDVYAKFDLGLCLKESGRNAEAFAAFEEVARDHPTYAKLRGLKQWRDFYRAQSK